VVDDGFVRVARGEAPRLELDGRPFCFILINAYYLQEEAARGRREIVDETLKSAAAIGAKVVRAWAFNDDPNKLDSAIQRGRLDYHERGLGGLDLLLDRARAHGLKLLLPLVNHWNAYGGSRQWLAWNGIRDAREGDARFFTDERVRAHYAAHLAFLLHRKNPLTGLRYCDDPTVLGWELMNEPRGRGLDGEGAALADWIGFAARLVKSHAPRQLVCAGDEGEQVSLDGHDARFWARAGALHLFSPSTGTSFSRHLACPELDLASCHFYPEKYGIAPGVEAEAGAAWIEEHAALARRAHKPLVVGEFGLATRRACAFRRFDAAARTRLYAGWLAAAERAEVAGIGPWLFAYRGRPAGWDDFTFYRPGPIARTLARAARRLDEAPRVAGKTW
jgi:mannan endo-1,4-beta-mannosidase